MEEYLPLVSQEYILPWQENLSLPRSKVPFLATVTETRPSRLHQLLEQSLGQMADAKRRIDEVCGMFSKDDRLGYDVA